LCQYLKYLFWCSKLITFSYMHIKMVRVCSILLTSACYNPTIYFQL
jgi:hypothetical protein